MTVTQCPQCSSTDVLFNDKKDNYFCKDCNHIFTAVKLFARRRVFLSYGRDEYAMVAERLKADLLARGHEVWFDKDRLKEGGDWEQYIEEGLKWVSADPANGRIVFLITPHSARRPDGYCLNEIAYALNRRMTVIPIMLVFNEPPLSICRVQYLDMQDCVPLAERRGTYEKRFERLLAALEDDKLDFEGVQSRLLKTLEPMRFDADVGEYLEKFTGRQWVFDTINAWLADGNTRQRVFWIMGGPGVGKSAICFWLSYKRREISAFHFCKFGNSEKANPRKVVLSIAYQLSTQLPEYQARLAQLNVEKLVAETPDAGTLFDSLIVQPFSRDFPRPDRDVVVLIDALDEATEKGRNELASFIAGEFNKTPAWLRMIITSRPEPEVRFPLQGLDPYILDTDTEQNRADIREYLARELVAYRSPTVDMKKAIEEILERSEGVFLYVKYVCAEVESGRLSITNLDQFPRGLGDMFVKFFQRRFPDENRYKEYIRAPLRSILAAREPLSVAVLSAMCGWNKELLSDFIDVLGSLFPVTGAGDNALIQPFHRSVIDWLIDKSKAGPYFADAEEGHRQLAGYGWALFEKDAAHLPPYFVSHLPFHLSQAGMKEEAERLLLDYLFIRAKVELGQVTELVEDYEQLENPSHEVKLMADTMRLSDHILREDPHQLPSQLHGRLLGREEHNIMALLEKAFKITTRTWLRPLNTCYTPPGGPLIRTLSGHSGGVWGVNITSNGKQCISASHDKTLKIWDINTGKELRSLKGHPKAVNDVCIIPNSTQVVSASSDKTLKIWDINTGKELRTLNGHTDKVNGVCITPNGKLAVSASSDKTLKVWDINTGKELLSLNGHTNKVNGVCITPNGKLAVSASSDRTLRVWDISTGKQIHALIGHSNSINGVIIAPDGQFVISASADRTLKVWNMETGAELFTLSGHTDKVFGVSITPNGRFAVSASFDNSLKVWDLHSQKQIYSLIGHTSHVLGVRITPDGNIAISTSVDSTLKVWDINLRNQQQTITGHSSRVLGISIIPDGNKAISGSVDSKIKIWDIITGKEVHSLTGHLDMVHSVSITTDGKLAVSASADKTLKVWDVKSGKELRTLRGHTSYVTDVSITPDGRLAVSTSCDKTLKIWDLKTGNELHTLAGHTDHVNGVKISPDGKLAASACKDNTIKIWNLSSGKEVRTLIGHTDRVYSVSITPDSTSVVSASKDNSLKIWDINSGNILQTLTGHTAGIYCVRINFDGRLIVSASCDRTLKLWGLNNGSEITSLTGEGGMYCCDIAEDNKTIVAGGVGGRVYFLRLENGEG